MFRNMKPDFFKFRVNGWFVIHPSMLKTKTTKGFHNFMLWTPASNMLCIEPITAYPYTGGEMLSKELFNVSKGTDTFKVEIIPS